jgi:hypothetical protein
MSTAYVSISGTVTGAPSGSKALGPFLIINPASVDAITLLSTASGDNTIAIPTGAVGCVIVPPTTNTVALKLKNVGGDSGLPIHPSQPTLLSLPAASTSFVLNAAGSAIAIELTWF